MKLEDFTSEMLDEIKSAKDLVKGELPELAKEYINMQMFLSKLGMIFGGVLISIGIACGIAVYLHVSHDTNYHNDEFKLGWGLVGTIVGMIGLIVTACNVSTYFEYLMQPRRMAIKAITSLKD